MAEAPGSLFLTTTAMNAKMFCFTLLEKVFFFQKDEFVVLCIHVVFK